MWISLPGKRGLCVLKVINERQDALGYIDDYEKVYSCFDHRCIRCVDEEKEVTAEHGTPGQVDPDGCELSKYSAETFRPATVEELNKNCRQLQNRYGSCSNPVHTNQIL